MQKLLEILERNVPQGTTEEDSVLKPDKYFNHLSQDDLVLMTRDSYKFTWLTHRLYKDHDLSSTERRPRTSPQTLCS